MIEIKNLSKIYKGETYEIAALNGISLTINEGEFVSIMGASGSGKTTLLNCIGLMDNFNAGEYNLNKVEVNTLAYKKYAKVRKEYISFIFQHFELMRNYTVYENIEIPLIVKNIKKSVRKKKIIEKCKLLHIDSLLDKYPFQLSGGQQQRVAIARALVADNPIILADEPTGALDSKNAQELMDILLSIKELGKTILLVTHDKNIAKYSDRIIRLEDGKIVEQR